MKISWLLAKENPECGHFGILMVTLTRHYGAQGGSFQQRHDENDCARLQRLSNREFFNGISSFGNSALPLHIELEALKIVKHQEYIPDLENGDVRQQKNTRSRRPGMG